MKNQFKRVVETVGDGVTWEAPRELNGTEKKSMFQRAKMHILMQDIFETMKDELRADEEIVDYMPFTNGENSMVFTSGLLGGMYAATTDATKNYVKDFHDVRGNRVLIFTTDRIILFFVIEFLGEKRYQSYWYEELPTMTLHEKVERFRYFDVDQKKFVKSQGSTYTLDFQTTKGNIFIESVSAKEAQKVQRIMGQIPKAQFTKIGDKHRRNSLFGYLTTTSNGILALEGVAVLVLLFMLVMYLVK
ncbi:hypothetical protein PWEIH_01762 [Listeria weihenstephanensis FSL R9-0317]|uniref:YokE-like PH domain-containing protein n=1 Tax=Listeria weihenstephanensis TaxID=1006155 RepID=A0A1S7FQJ5_9LIST|nr:hypothetical protein [Listeria weihenstephanensis]AQY49708.1 hypothetical protein UE46_00610 [Listeria weihenstephanensis]EUJ40998.1 hypothetical protein PWEIH_01762 [Listeria weihenstephanensis FSL R9-0317]